MKATKIVGVLSIVAGIIMIVAGALTWGTVTSQLQAERITVPGDSQFMGGAFKNKEVGGPLTAFAQAEAINMHAMKASEGKTYAELGALVTENKDNPEVAEKYQAQRNTVMNGSFLRASLFSSVIAYGVSALVMGLGVMMLAFGFAFNRIASVPAPAAAVTKE